MSQSESCTEQRVDHHLKKEKVMTRRTKAQLAKLRVYSPKEIVDLIGPEALQSQHRLISVPERRRIEERFEREIRLLRQIAGSGSLRRQRDQDIKGSARMTQRPDMGLAFAQSDNRTRG